MSKKQLNIQDVRGMLASRTGMKKEDAETALRVTFDIIKQLMYDDNEIRIPNFGVFQLNVLKSRTMVMPITKQSFFKEARFAPRLRFSGNFKKQIRAKKCTQE